VPDVGLGATIQHQSLTTTLPTGERGQQSRQYVPDQKRRKKQPQYMSATVRGAGKQLVGVHPALLPIVSSDSTCNREHYDYAREDCSIGLKVGERTSKQLTSGFDFV